MLFHMKACRLAHFTSLWPQIQHCSQAQKSEQDGSFIHWLILKFLPRRHSLSPILSLPLSVPVDMTHILLFICTRVAGGGKNSPKKKIMAEEDVTIKVFFLTLYMAQSDRELSQFRHLSQDFFCN